MTTSLHHLTLVSLRTSEPQQPLLALPLENIWNPHHCSPSAVTRFIALIFKVRSKYCSICSVSFRIKPDGLQSSVVLSSVSLTSSSLPGAAPFPSSPPPRRPRLQQHWLYLLTTLFVFTPLFVSLTKNVI